MFHKRNEKFVNTHTVFTECLGHVMFVFPSYGHVLFPVHGSNIISLKQQQATVTFPRQFCRVLGVLKYIIIITKYNASLLKLFL